MSDKKVVVYALTWRNGKVVAGKPVQLTKAGAANVIKNRTASQPAWCLESELNTFGLELEKKPTKAETPVPEVVEEPAKAPEAEKPNAPNRPQSVEQIEKK